MDYRGNVKLRWKKVDQVILCGLIYGPRPATNFKLFWFLHFLSLSFSLPKLPKRYSATSKVTTETKVTLPVFRSAAVLFFSWAGVPWVPWLYCNDLESPVPDSALVVLITALDDLLAVDSDFTGTSDAEVCFKCFPSCWSCWSCWSCSCCRRSSSSSLRGSSLSGLKVTGAEDTFLLEKDSKSFLNVTFPGKSSG